MSERVRYADIRHDCRPPKMDHLPTWGADGQVMARWRCSVCRARWRYQARFLSHNEMRWMGGTYPSWRWRRRERKRLEREARS